MEQIQFDFFEEPDIAETVYESLLGQLIPEFQLPWVENIFVPGHSCYEEYSRMWCAYEHLRDRLGVVDEDKDAEIMIQSLLSYGEIIAMEMFRYGREYQKKIDSF